MNDLGKLLLGLAWLMMVLIISILAARSVNTTSKPNFTMGLGWTCMAWHNEVVPDPEGFVGYKYTHMKQVSVCDQWKRLSKPPTETTAD